MSREFKIKSSEAVILQRKTTKPLTEVINYGGKLEWKEIAEMLWMGLKDVVPKLSKKDLKGFTKFTKNYESKT